MNLKTSTATRNYRARTVGTDEGSVRDGCFTFFEEESGTYTTRFRHPHNGYYAGDFSQTPRSGPDRHMPYQQHRPDNGLH